MKSITYLYIFLLVLLIVPTVTAFEFDNVKTFEKTENDKYGTITIKNSFLLIPTTKVAEYELLINENSVIDARAEGTVTTYETGQLFQNLKFLDIYRNQNQIRHTIFIETTEEFDVDVPIFSECKSISANGCNETIIGYNGEHRKITYWKEYKMEEVPAGKYKWKIEAQKNSPSDIIDWVPTVFGVELNEWAWWDTSWLKKRAINISAKQIMTNTSFIVNVTWDSDMQADFDDLRFVNASETGELGYWFYNNTYVSSNSVQVWVRVPATIDPTINMTIYMYYDNVGASTTSNIQTAFIFGDDFNGSTVNFVSGWQSASQSLYTIAAAGSYLNASSTGTANNLISTNRSFINFTWEARTRTNSVSTDGWYHVQGTAAQTYLSNDRAQTTGSAFLISAAGADLSGGTSVNDVWYRLAGIFPQSGAFIQNFTSDVYGNMNGSIPYTSLFGNSGTPPDARTRFPSFLRFSSGIGQVDWVYIRPFINQDKEPTYVIGAEQNNLVPAFSVNVTLLSPANNSNLKISTVQLNASTMPTYGNISNGTFYIYWSNGTIRSTHLNNTFTTTNNQTNITSVVLNLADANNYQWNLYACGFNYSAGNSSCDFALTNYTFNIDTLGEMPQQNITLLSPLNNSNITTTSITLNASITSYNSSVTNGTFYIWWSNGTLRSTHINNTFSPVNGSINVTFLVTSLTDAVYKWNLLGVVANGTNFTLQNSSFSNENFTFTIDTLQPNITFVAPTPVNGNFSGTNNITINVTATDTNGIANITIRIFDNNQNIYAENTSIVSPNNWTKTLVDGLYFYNATATDINNIVNYTLTRNITIDMINPTINLTYPLNTTYNNLQTTLNYTVSDTNLQSCWYSVNGGVTNISVTCGINITGLNSGQGSSTWNVYANDSSGRISNSTRTFFVDTISPVINFTYPLNIKIPYHMAGTNLTINFTASDSGTILSACLIEYNGLNRSVGCGTNTTQYNITSNTNRTAIFRVNDSLNNVNITITSWNYTVFDYSRQFTRTTTEFASEVFAINFTYDSDSYSGISVNLWHNGTSYTSSQTASGGGNVVYNQTIVIPAITSQLNATLLWQIILTNSTGTNIINTTSSTQTINVLTIDNCTTGTILVLNYTLLNEDTEAILANTTVPSLNLTGEVFMVIKSPSDISNSKNFSMVANNTNPIQVCVNNLNATYVIDVTTRYQSSPTYVSEFHNIQNRTISTSTVPININLLDLLTTRSQEFLISFKDKTLLPVSDALINIQRLYISQGQYKTVEIPKTDREGNTLGHFVLSEPIYQITVSKNGKVLGIFPNIQPKCEDSSIGNCRLPLTELANQLALRDYSTVRNITHLLTFNSTSNIITLNYVVISGNPELVRLNVSKFDGFGNHSVCNIASPASASGRLECPVPASLGNATVMVEVFANSKLIVRNFFTIGDSSDAVFGTMRVVIAILLILALALIGIGNAPVMIITMLFGFILVVSLNLIEMTFAGAASSFLWIIVSSGIILWKVSRGREV